MGRQEMKGSRRWFLRTVGGAVATFGSALWAQEATSRQRLSPNDKLGIGFIGVGGMGRGLLGWFLAQPDCNVVALCDVASGH